MLKSGGSAYHKGAVSADESTTSAYSLLYNEAHGEFSATYGIRQAIFILKM